MARGKKSLERQSFRNQDLVLGVSPSVDRNRWNEDRYEGFIDELCGDREYQKNAIRVVLRYLLGGQYSSLRDLAQRNFAENVILQDRYGTAEGMLRSLQLPDQLAASLDLATGTGKSYVLYGIGAIMLAEGAVDRVLVLCPSTTIEQGLTEKFELLSGNSDLRDVLPPDAKTTTPRIINASESIVDGSICIENYHAILEHVRSSIRDSLKGKGARTLVLNDEAHHVANEAQGHIRRWKEFLTNADFGFRYVIGVSGTCYVENDYFADVIYRFALREAIEQRFVKKIRYITDMPRPSRPEEKWQIIRNSHEDIKRRLRPRKVRPLTIIVTPTIVRCKDVADELTDFLAEETGKSREEVSDQVLTVHSEAADLSRLPNVDRSGSKVEWIVSVSMLNEGWDVKRVFQIVPHEERAFNSKLLIAQVLGRGLRIPDNWSGEQPEVTVLNHDAWASRIVHLVNEVREIEQQLPTFSVATSPFNFDLLNIKYDPQAYTTTHSKEEPYKLFEKGYVDLATEQPTEDLTVEFEDAVSGKRTKWQTRIVRQTYSPREIAEVMHDRLAEAQDPSDPDPSSRTFYTDRFPVAKLETIIKKSLSRRHVKEITDGIRQKFLASLGTLQRKGSQVTRYRFDAVEYVPVATTNRPVESASAADLRNTKRLFFTEDTRATFPDDVVREFFDGVTEEGSGFRAIKVPNKFDLKTALNAVIADHENELKFIKGLFEAKNASHLDAWIKSTPIRFYEIDYAWKKGEHPKRGKFSPDFFIKKGNLILVVEVKDESEIAEASPENIKKNEYAIEHCERLNTHFKQAKKKTRYKFNFLTPSDFNKYFQALREGTVADFRSALDVKLAE